MKNPSFRAAVALPAALLLALGATVLSGGAALAATAPAPAPSAASVSGGTAGSSTAAPTPAAAASSTPSASPSPSPAAPTAPGAAAPSAARAAAAATELTVTAPLPDRDGVVKHPGSRTLTITGTAPVGAVITVREAFAVADRPFASMTTTTPEFSLPVTFPADGPYDLLAEVSATVGTKALEPTYIDFVFDAPRSTAPTITSPVDGERITTTALPFQLALQAPTRVVTGTGTPGDDILLFFTPPGDTFNYDEYGQLDGDALGAQVDDVTVGDDGTWSADVVILDGDVQITAAQVEYWPGAFYEPVTHVSPLSAAAVVTLGPPAGTVIAPVIEHPSYADDIAVSVGAGESGGDAESDDVPTSQGAIGAAESLGLSPSTVDLTTYADGVRARSVPVLAAHPGRIAGLLAAGGGHDAAASAASVPSASEPAASATATTATPAAVDTTGLDDFVSGVGIRLKGTADPAHPGRRLVTVSGTGTPGDHVVLYGDRASTAYRHLDRLYPGLFAGVAEGVLPDPLVVDAAYLPADDGSIVVDAKGAWRGTISLVPGPILLTAFAAEPRGAAAPAFSVAGALIPVDLVAPAATVDPAGSPASPPELAMTGSTPWSIGLAGAALLTAGGALLVAARRRRA